MNRILVTGGTGFLGKSLCTDLHSIGMVHAVNSSMYDLTDYVSTEQMYKDFNPNIVVHLAATVGGIGANKINPGLFIDNNLSMGSNVIRLAKKYNVDKFVMIGTVCSYPKNCPVPFKEEDIWNGYPEETNAPYGIAKKTLMQMVQSYHQQYGFNGLNLIPVNMYGPNDNFDPKSSHVIPALILKFQNAINDHIDNVEIWGTGTASREFLYVDDCANAIKLAIQHYNSPDFINIGTGSEITIYDLAYKIKHLMGYDGDIVFNKDYPDGQPRRCLDISRAKNMLSWTPKVTLDEGLKNTIEWYRKNYG
jgi:GDP-L-fucose synthase